MPRGVRDMGTTRTTTSFVSFSQSDFVTSTLFSKTARSGHPATEFYALETRDAD